MIKHRKLKSLLLIAAFFIIGLVAVLKPEYAENVAQAFLLILGII